MTYTEPLMLVVVVWVLVGILLRRKWLAFSGVVGLVLITLPAAEWVFSRPLEGSYPVRPFVQPPDVEAIVVFSGGVEPPEYERPYAEANRDTYERCRYAAWIYRQSQVPVLACGGGPPHGKHPPFFAAMREILIQNGVAEDSIWTEAKSTNTHENAMYGAEILRQHRVHRVTLVVDGRSMKRAMECLRKQGIQVSPAPSRFGSGGPVQEEWIPGWKGLKGNEETLHEVLGWLWYRIRGWV